MSGDEGNYLSVQMELGSWTEKAEENVEEWGLQDVDTLLLAMQEEQGELAQRTSKPNTRTATPPASPPNSTISLRCASNSARGSNSYEPRTVH
ncbi:hypothetical protein [Halorubrum sp. Boch-26]|uniref:hypothetical protein n=1 Tax=Halorubrum sp. Boch-26 TaxID=2994426 RepID=UPI0024684EE7|nr:hypothetical protein [Halorubrum sp. Boch-26]